MKKSFYKAVNLAVVFFLVAGCSKKYYVNKSVDACACNCPNPEFVSAEFVSVAAAAEQENLTLAVLLKTAKERQGYDVSIQNIQWDIKNGKRISAIFDVVRCNKKN